MIDLLLELVDLAKVEKQPSMEGKRMTAIVAPRSDRPLSTPLPRPEHGEPLPSPRRMAAPGGGFSFWACSGSVPV